MIGGEDAEKEAIEDDERGGGCSTEAEKGLGGGGANDELDLKGD